MCQYPILSSTPNPDKWRQTDVTEIEEFVQELLDANGNTTNLEIKEYMREDGIWILQKDVAWTMTWLCEQNNWYAIMDPTDTYRIYYPDYQSAEDALLDQVVSTDDDTVAGVGNGGQPAGKAVPRSRFGDWELFVYGDDTYPTITLRNMWRNEARNQYSLDFGVLYFKVAANKAK